MKNIKEMLLKELEVRFVMDGTSGANEIFTDIELNSEIKPMVFTTELEHTMLEGYVVPSYTEFTSGRIEKNTITNEVSVWMILPAHEDVQVKLDESVKMIGYNPIELKNEIIKRWETDNLYKNIKDCGTMKGLLNTLAKNNMVVTNIGIIEGDEQTIIVDGVHKITYQVLDVDENLMVNNINIVIINDEYCY